MYARLTPVSRGGQNIFLFLNVPLGPPKREKRNDLVIRITQRPSRPRSSPAPPGAGLRSRGDESDQSDQSTEITVIPEVRRRAPGHTEFTHPTQAP